jgi:hypothetical protein
MQVEARVQAMQAEMEACIQTEVEERLQHE